MQLSEFTFVFLTLCIPFLIYIVYSTSPKKGFSILFVLIIGVNGFINQDNFSLLGLFFLAFYLYSFEKVVAILKDMDIYNETNLSSLKLFHSLWIEKNEKWIEQIHKISE